jgi:hypothetical protein
MTAAERQARLREKRRLALLEIASKDAPERHERDAWLRAALEAGKSSHEIARGLSRDGYVVSAGAISANLTSNRAVARELGVSAATVRRARDRLGDEG